MINHAPASRTDRNSTEPCHKNSLRPSLSLSHGSLVSASQGDATQPNGHNERLKIGTPHLRGARASADQPLDAEKRRVPGGRCGSPSGTSTLAPSCSL